VAHPPVMFSKITTLSLLGKEYERNSFSEIFKSSVVMDLDMFDEHGRILLSNRP